MLTHFRFFNGDVKHLIVNLCCQCQCFGSFQHTLHVKSDSNHVDSVVYCFAKI